MVHDQWDDSISLKNLMVLLLHRWTDDAFAAMPALLGGFIVSGTMLWLKTIEAALYTKQESTSVLYILGCTS